MSLENTIAAAWQTGINSNMRITEFAQHDAKKLVWRLWLRVKSDEWSCCRIKWSLPKKNIPERREKKKT
jgi:hypothetical protein